MKPQITQMTRMEARAIEPSFFICDICDICGSNFCEIHDWRNDGD